jgi:hypothetical protein
MMEGCLRSPIHTSTAFGHALIFKTFFPFIQFVGLKFFEPFGENLHEKGMLPWISGEHMMQV